MSKNQLLLVSFILLSLAASAQFTVNIESGAAFSGYNDVKVPNGMQNSGTLFSLHDDFTPQNPAAFIRVELAVLLKDKHTIELTAAPLALNFTQSKREQISFAGEGFSKDETDGRYEFNTYRASYRYRLVDKKAVTFDLGATGLVRDARIALKQNSLTAKDTDLGVVPLVSFKLKYKASDILSLVLKGDALVGPQGRAEDIFTGALFHVPGTGLSFKTGYRIIEGGADVNQVYNFALIHFADAGLVYQL